MSTVRHSFRFAVTAEPQGGRAVRWPLQHDGELSWQADDPHAVTMHLVATGEGKSWRFGWELLLDSLDGPAGVGDVVITPLPQLRRHQILLRNPRGRAYLQVMTGVLRVFVDAVAPLWADVRPDDAAFTALLDEAAQ